MVNLENESVMLRKEIKESKFNNEKQGYAGFLGGLTKLREGSRLRSTSKNQPNRRYQASAERPLVE